MHSPIIFAENKHLEEIVNLWGANRATLGLMPKDAFAEYIKKKWILICIEDGTLAGYLQFRFTKKTQVLAIVHLCVASTHRGKKISEALLNSLVYHFRNKARGIRLSCRSDYQRAIAFWNRYGFQPKDKLPSRGSDPGVHLIVWWYSFGTVDLFSLQQSDKIQAILDFNIIAKMMNPEADELNFQEIGALQSDWLASEAEYFKTSETTNEIFRDKNLARQKKSQLFLKRYPELNVDKSKVKAIEDRLLNTYRGTTENDQSDRRQLAESIISGYPYFITLDEGILRHQKTISEEFGIKIVRPSTFISEIDSTVNPSDYYPSQLSASNFTIGKLRPQDREYLCDLFLSNSTGEKKSVFNQFIDSTIANSSGRVTLITQKNEKVAFYAHHEDKEYILVTLIRTKNYELQKTIFMQNINDLLKITLQDNKKYLVISDSHLKAHEKEVLNEFSFFEVDQKWIRAVSEGITSIKNISEILNPIIKIIPKLSEVVKGITEAKDMNFYLNMFSLEKILWPLKIQDAEIPCFIIPIKPHYARELFDTKAAKSELFGVEPKLIWNKENVYYRAIQPNVERFPARILWYASAGSDKNNTRSMSIVCSSYLDEVIVGPAKELFRKHERYGIYTWKKDILPLAKNTAENAIKLLRFSDSEVFEQPVKLERIRAVLAGNSERDNNFQSPKLIKNTTFMQIYALGKGLKP